MFEGKVVLVYLVDPTEAFNEGIGIYNPRVEDCFGRKFVTGTVPSNPDDWASGLKVSVALDQVAHLLEFSDEEEFWERITSTVPGTHGKRIQ